MTVVTFGKLVKTHANWYATEENGEDYDIFEVGKREVKELRAIEDENGVTFVRVLYNDGRIEIVYNINRMFYAKPEETVHE